MKVLAFFYLTPPWAACITGAMARTSSPAPRYVPMLEDLVVYAKAVLRYRSTSLQSDLRCVVLAQRVLLERAKAQRTRGAEEKVLSQINHINNDPRGALDVSHALDHKTTPQVLPRTYPLYVQADLL